MKFDLGMRIRLGGALIALSLFSFAGAQYNFNRVTLLANMSPTLFGSSGGNDCWGYVSPSGREYALMGLRNQVAFVEVTDPKNPVWFASVPHINSTWGDIKVYGHHAYAVTEATGSGLQVIDMSQIDNHVVTLVKTIDSPGRTHNLAMDAESGFLYTCGSRNGTGTTMCFSLANPGNPVRVGADTMSERYQHDAIVVPYTEGPYAGRQIFFGFSEDRGVDIIDVTNKSAPFLIKRVVYPNMRYCHQGWLSADRKYLYVDDELDETGMGHTTRTLVFNVASFENATYVGTFSSGLNASDHNQYVDDGFIFQANYKSGLRIFDTYRRETSPLAVGFFDTYPESNASGFEGAWSTYPYFPSGTVIVSDINRGLFIFDASDALTRNAFAGKYWPEPGMITAGGGKDLSVSDDDRVVLSKPTSNVRSPEPVVLAVQFESPTAQPLRLRLEVEARAPQTPLKQIVEWFDPQTQAYVASPEHLISTMDEAVAIEAPDTPSRFIASDRLVVVRIRYVPQNPRFTNHFSAEIDKAMLKVVR